MEGVHKVAESVVSVLSTLLIAHHRVTVSKHAEHEISELESVHCSARFSFAVL